VNACTACGRPGSAAAAAARGGSGGDGARQRRRASATARVSDGARQRRRAAAAATAVGAVAGGSGRTEFVQRTSGTLTAASSEAVTTLLVLM
jgi:hypothetical protein